MNHFKKIMFICPYYPPKTGGVENYVYNISQGLIKEFGLEVVVITSTDRGNNRTVEKRDLLTIYRLPTSFTFSNTPINPKWFYNLKKIISTEQPDIINAHAPVPYISDIAAFAAGNIPFVLTYHAGTMKKNKFLYDFIIYIYEAIVFQFLRKKAVKIICSSKFVQKSMFKKYKSKSVVITPGVDVSLFHPDPKIKKEENTVLFISSHAKMYRMKGMFTLLDAVQDLPNVSLRIIGEPISLNLKNVSFVGRKYGLELIREIQKASVLVLASLAHMESFGMVLIEAMACKTPVIGTAVGGIPEVIKDGVDGLIVPANNPKELRKAILEILNDKEKAKKMGEQGNLKIRSSFTWNKKVKETYNLFKSI